MNKTASIIITIVLVIGLGIIFGGSSKSNNNTTTASKQVVQNRTTASKQVVQNSVIKDGVQYIIINAKSGYSPKISTAQAGIPTKLIVKTDGTYDCSASLAIHSIGYQKILPQTGETVIDIGYKKAGETLQGVCGMGMFSFQIKFS
jgi:plastocyanin domain-containing protein